ncbi:hypothetical protein BCV69DRAFT_281314 [Microstroma glucosiphilum]|uniref:DUF1770-domain-containing protein n=1 Tax=Pseudomicrostroma glucosiphilum TaxID=1684307 RepID=A0A316UBS1_9BASI|nr:hypothetical protein BCV69DRAFT_281314 [Pseudomicrostroma glucosiphilum]PWN22308.1 hypothetical protein BCV69DRAFT_281314 [Pseudomicrostroma glucosiphilum]
MAFFYRRASSPVPPLSPTSSSPSSAASSSSLDEPPPHRRPNRPSDHTKRRAVSPAPGAPSIGVAPAVIPDMRFEQSYLASIRGFIHELEPAQARREKKEAIAASRRKHRGVIEEEGGVGEEEEVGEEEGERWIEARNPKGEPELWIGRLRIDWVPLLYVTFRDQLLSPLVQGAVWGVVGLCLTQGKGALKAYLSAPRAQKRRGSARGGGWWGFQGVTGLQERRSRSY